MIEKMVEGDVYIWTWDDYEGPLRGPRPRAGVDSWHDMDFHFYNNVYERPANETNGPRHAFVSRRVSR